jgi:ABC-type lipoprotein release transport system permease subunit
VDPAAEDRLARFPGRVHAGRFFGPDDHRSAVLGSKLLDNLKAGIGDTLVLLAQGYDGVLGNELYTIVGTVKLGTPEFDQMGVFLHLRGAQELLAMEGRVNVVALGVGELHDIPVVRDSLTAALLRARSGDLVVLPWQEVLPELQQAMELDLIGDWFFLGILIVIVTFGILNTVLMSVTERFREFGVSLAVGMPPRSLVLVVFLETVFLAMIGIVLGVAAGNLLNRYLAANPITLTGDFEAMYEEYGFMPQILASPDITIVVNVGVIMLLVSLLATLYPASRVARLEPLKGIRHT